MQTSEYCSSGYKGNLKVYFNFVCYAYDNVSQSTVAMCEVGRKYVSWQMLAANFCRLIEKSLSYASVMLKHNATGFVRLVLGLG